MEAPYNRGDNAPTKYIMLTSKTVWNELYLVNSSAKGAL